MKARVKATGEIVELAKYSTIYLEHYDKNYHLCELEFIQDIVEFSSIDWEQRRYELAKEVLPIMLQWYGDGTISKEENVTRNVIKFADALIAELKKINETK